MSSAASPSRRQTSHISFQKLILVALKMLWQHFTISAAAGLSKVRTSPPKLWVRLQSRSSVERLRAPDHGHPGEQEVLKGRCRPEELRVGGQGEPLVDALARVLLEQRLDDLLAGPRGHGRADHHGVERAGPGQGPADRPGAVHERRQVVAVPWLGVGRVRKTNDG